MQRLKAKYKNGAITFDENPPGFDLRPMSDDNARYYGGRFMLCESLSFNTAKQLCLDCGWDLVEVTG